MSPEQTMAARRQGNAASVYVEAHGGLAAAQAAHGELVGLDAPAAVLLESRSQLERARGRLAAAQAGVVNAAWADGRLMNAHDLGRAVAHILAGVLADAATAGGATS
jgi:hypothetical protein